jgi:hypothetical protein
MRKLRLDYHKEFEHFTLRDPYMSTDTESFAVVLDRQTVDDMRYRFIVWRDGEWFECLTQKQYQERVRDIVDNEGQEVADIWEAEQECYRVIPNNHAVFSIKRKWEALLELELIDIPICYHRWEGKPLSKSTIEKLDAARDKWMREEAEAMREEASFNDEE